jgi:hypothetical protein
LASGAGYRRKHYRIKAHSAAGDTLVDSPDQEGRYSLEQSGCDELILIPSASELDQVALLAEVVMR